MYIWNYELNNLTGYYSYREDIFTPFMDTYRCTYRLYTINMLQVVIKASLMFNYTIRAILLLQ